LHRHELLQHHSILDHDIAKKNIVEEKNRLILSTAKIDFFFVNSRRSISDQQCTFAWASQFNFWSKISKKQKKIFFLNKNYFNSLTWTLLIDVRDGWTVDGERVRIFGSLFQWTDLWKIWTKNKIIFQLIT